MSQSIFPLLIVDTFIPSLWTLQSTTLTREYADLHYLKFPLAQGSETFPSNISVSGTTNLGITTINGYLTLNNTEIHLGTGSGINQGANSIAIGRQAGSSGQGNQAVSLGYGTGQTNQGANATALGHNAGNSNQGAGSIAIGHNSGETSQGIQSIAIGKNAGDNSLAANSIQINSTGTTVSQTTASSCVIAPIRTTAPSTAGNYSLPLLYDTTSKELFNNNLPSIILTAIGNTADNSYYNSFITITSGAAGTVNIPTPVVNFPATIIFYNNTNTTKTLTTPLGTGITRVFTGVASSNTFVVPIGGIVRLDTNGAVWYLTSSGGLASILNTIQFGYAGNPTRLSSNLGYNTNHSSTTASQTFNSPTLTTITGCVSASLPVGVYIFSAKILLTAASAVGNQNTFDFYANSGGVSVFSYNYITTSTLSGTFSDIVFSFIYQIQSEQSFSLRAAAIAGNITIGAAGTTTFKLVRIG